MPLINSNTLNEWASGIPDRARGLYSELLDAPRQIKQLFDPQYMRAVAKNAASKIPPGTTLATLPEEQKQKLMNLGMDVSPGGLMGIVKPQIAKTLNIKKQLPIDDVFEMAVKNTPSAQITDEGLLLNLQRNQLPEQNMAESVRGGVFYLPEGAAQAKYYSTGKYGYGGKQKITGETLLVNPLLAKGGTGGKVPESAYDSLLGKGAYQKMREDALKVRNADLIKERGSTLQGAITPEDFLAKYAPDLQGMGNYIFNNSRQGNQLAYALQEAAVGSAVRNAGHDAVLGYSKGKSGPFLSEIFDVREKRYPGPAGEFEVWPNLYKQPLGLLAPK